MRNPNEDAPSCKVCGAATSPFDSLDFNRSCEERRGLILPKTGLEIAYWRCSARGLIFTVAFDDWDDEAFASRIYNEGYQAARP